MKMMSSAEAARCAAASASRTVEKAEIGYRVSVIGYWVLAIGWSCCQRRSNSSAGKAREVAGCVK